MYFSCGVGHKHCDVLNKKCLLCPLALNIWSPAGGTVWSILRDVTLEEVYPGVGFESKTFSGASSSLCFMVEVTM